MRKFCCGLVLGFLLIPVAALIAGWFPVPATETPSRWESFFARKAFAASVNHQAPQL